MNEGKYNLAKTSFREVLKLYPSHPQARRQLVYIQSNMSTLETNQRKKLLKQVIIPEVNLEKATVQESVEVLSSHIKTNSKDKKSPNIIVQDSKSLFKGKTVTLRLSKVPAETLLKYITDQVDGQTRYDTHAIVIRPRPRDVQPEQ